MMATETVRIKFKAHEAQKLVLDSSARFRILAAGRRFGKSYLAAVEAIKAASFKEKQIVWCVAPIFAQTRKLWRTILDLLPNMLIRNINRSELCIELINGSSIWFRSADNPDSLRGEGIHFLILDEAAIISRECWEASLRPALSDTKGRALFISTPKSFNWFHELFTRGQLPEETEFKSWRFATSDSPFIDEAGSVFRGVNDCIRGELQEPIEGHSYVMGVDLAKSFDFTVLIVIDTSTKQVVAFQRFNQISWPFQKEKILSLAKKYYNARTIIDSTGVGDPIFDDLSRNNLSVTKYQFTNDSKAKLIEALSIAIEQREVSFPNITELVNELHSFGFETLPSGRMRYTAPSGLHDDCVISLALTWKAQKGSGFFCGFIEWAPPSYADDPIYKTRNSYLGY